MCGEFVSGRALVEVEGDTGMASIRGFEELPEHQVRPSCGQGKTNQHLWNNRVKNLLGELFFGWFAYLEEQWDRRETIMQISSSPFNLW